MKSWLRFHLTVLVVVLVPTTASAAVPDFVTYSGRLTDGTGWGESTTLGLTLSVWDAETDGTELWTNTFDAVPVEDGYFNVSLGMGTQPGTEEPLSVVATFTANGPVWLSLAVGADETLSPRQAVGATPYTAHCENAERVSMLDLAALDDRYILEQQGTDLYIDEAGDTMSGSLSLPANGLTVGADQLTTKNGNVGIGHSSPGSPLHVVGRTHIQTSGTSEADGFSVGTNPDGGQFGHQGRLKLWYDFDPGSPAKPFGYIDVKTGGIAAHHSRLLLLPSGGSVGIGTTETTNTLDVAGIGRFRDGVLAGSNSDVNGSRHAAFQSSLGWFSTVVDGLVLRACTGETDFLSFRDETNTIEEFYVRHNNTTDNTADVYVSGRLGVGETSLAYDLYVDGPLYANSINAGSCPACSSDSRIKRNIHPIQDALDKVLALTGVSFEFDGSDYPEMDLPEGPQIGLIAQEVEEVLPEVVMSPPDDGLKSVKYANLVAVLIEAVKEQQGQIDTLHEEIDTLHEENITLHEENDELRTRLDRLERAVGIGRLP